MTMRPANLSADTEICYLVNEVGPTSVPLDLAVALEQYEDVTVEIVSWYDNELSGSARGIDVTSLGQNRRVSPAGIYALSRTLRQFDLIQIHHHLTGFITRLLFGLSDTLLVSRVGNVRHGFSFAGRNLNTLTHPLCDAIVCNSQSVYDSLTGVDRRLAGEETFQIIPNGFDPKVIEQSLARDSDILDGLPTGRMLVSNASVMTEQKALDVLVRAFAQANDRTDIAAHLVLAGDGPKRTELQTQVTRLGIEGNVTFTGMLQRHEVHQLMDASDVYAMPSRWEGFSAASLEAMGIGTACVFSAIQPFLQPFEGNALFHDVDDAACLADKLETLIADPDLRSDYASNAGSHVRETYHMADTARSYRELYGELVRTS